MSLYASHHHCFAVAAFAILPLEKISEQSTSTILYLCLVSSSMLIIPSSHIKKCLGRPARFHAWSKQRATWPVKCHQNFLGAMKAISSGGSRCGTDRLMKLQYQETSSLVYSSKNRYHIIKMVRLRSCSPGRAGRAMYNASFERSWTPHEHFMLAFLIFALSALPGAKIALPPL